LVVYIIVLVMCGHTIIEFSPAVFMQNLKILCTVVILLLRTFASCQEQKHQVEGETYFFESKFRCVPSQKHLISHSITSWCLLFCVLH